MPEQLNSATGLRERQIIVSVPMLRTTLEKLNFTALDPLKSVQKFNNTMKLNKTDGF